MKSPSTKLTRRGDNVKIALAESFAFCSHAAMTHDPHMIADAILTGSSGFARVGITAPSFDIRQKAALELATTIAQRLDQPDRFEDRRQLALPL